MNAPAQHASMMEHFETPKMRRLIELLRMWTTLTADVDRLEKDAKSEEIQTSFHRRQYSRAAAALIEGFISMLKQDVLMHPECFSPEELLLLREKEPFLKDNGMVSVKDRFIRIEDNIRFAFAAYAKCHSVAYTLDCSTSEWTDFKRLFSVRNRITHPKDHSDLTLTDDDLVAIKNGLSFVSRNHTRLQTDIKRKILLDAGLPPDMFDRWEVFAQDLVKARSEDERAFVQKEFDADLDEGLKRFYAVP